ncbi:hypothetical protein DICPUDRAFT_29435, partial [Dictyostelium purpureum]
PAIKNLSLPIIGHIYLFSELPNRSVKELSEKYGGIFSFWIGDRYSIVVSDPEWINQIWSSSEHFDVFVNRPHFKTFEIFSEGYRNLSFSNDEIWKNIRKLVAGSFTKTKVKNYESLVEYETNIFLNSIKDHVDNNKPFYPKLHCHTYSLNIVSDVSYGRKICGEGMNDMHIFEEPKKIIFKKLGASLVEDSMFFQKFFYHWTMKEYEDSFKAIREYLNEIYDQHVQQLDQDNPKDIMDLLIIGTNYNQVEVVSSMVDFLIAGSDTVGVTVEWFLLLMANHKDIQEKAYKEIIDEFGRDCTFIPYSEKLKTPYINACIREVSRVKPTTSLGLPRTTSKDTTVNNYFIPKNTLIIQNIYGMGTSKRYLDDPDVYRPERWIEYNKLKELKIKINQMEDSKEKDYFEQKIENKNKFFNDLERISIPFGYGPRGCVGMNLGVMELYVLCANILLNYIIEPWDGNHIDETEDFGITIHPKPHNLKLIPRK